MKDFVIIGGGIGGSASAALLSQKGYRVTLLEKEPYLGGCSSTFSHQGYRYNAGATTFAGYGKGLPVYELFQTLGLTPSLQAIDPALCVVTPKGTIKRYQDLTQFLKSLNKTLPHAGNEAFWSLVYEVNHAFYTYQDYYYSTASFSKKMRSLLSFFPLAVKFWPYLFKSSAALLEKYLPNRSSLYQHFIDAQLLIVAQSTSKDLNALSTILALGYTFLPNFYVQGGMGALFETLRPTIDEVQTKTTVTHIDAHDDHYKVSTNKEVIETRNIVLNTPVFTSGALFDDPKIKHHFDTFTSLDNDQSAFMLYLTLASDAIFEHHYQVLLDAPLPHTASSALFISFSDKDDTTISPKGTYSVTISIHTKESWWRKMDKKSYKKEKEVLVSKILDHFCDTLNIKKEHIVHCVGATPKTFGRFINRSQLGGNPMSRFFFQNPSNDSPFKGLYRVGDTTFAAQGWPGVMAGVMNLDRLLHERT